MVQASQARGAEVSEPSAADVATARELFREAALLAKEGKWQQALDRYQRSMELRPSSLTRYSIAVAQERLGLLVESMENLRAFVREADSPEAQNFVPAANELIRSVESRIGRIKIVVPGDPRGTVARIDGVVIPPAAIGVERPTNPGVHRIEVQVPGYSLFRQQITLAEAETETVVVQNLTRLSAAAGSDTSADTGSSRKTLGWVLVGSGAAVFGGGLTMGIVGWNKAKDSPTSDGDQADTAKAFALASDVMMGAGLVLAGTGTYLVLSSPSKDKAVSIAPVLGTTGAAVVAGGFF